MKKSFPVNINGTIFYIDEDAYALLNTYLEQLERAFPGQEGKEIVADIEARISELFAERLASGASVIAIEDVNTVIEQMGRPQDFSEGNVEDEGAESQSAAQDSPSSEGPSTPPPFTAPEAEAPRKRLFRDERDKVLGGVLGGIACYMNWNVNILRIFFVLALFIPYTFLLWVLLYLLAWMVIPAASTPQQVLEMQGQPVTINNLGQAILDAMNSGNPSEKPSGNAFGSFMKFLGKLVAIVFCVGGCLIGALVTFFLIFAVCALIVYWGWGSFELMSDLPFYMHCGNPVLGVLGMAVLFVALLIVCAGVIWAAGCALFNWKDLSKGSIIALAVLVVLLIIASVVMIAVAKIPM